MSHSLADFAFAAIPFIFVALMCIPALVASHEYGPEPHGDETGGW